MTLSRRFFLGGSALSALTTGSCVDKGGQAMNASAPALGSTERRILDMVVDRALETARRAGASYADVRVVRRRYETVATREDHVVSVGFGETYGVGVRVLVDGVWGFASTADVEAGAAAAAAQNAVALARAARPSRKRAVELAPAPSVRASWPSPMQVDPFTVPLGEKAQYLLELWPLVKNAPLVKYATASLESNSEWKLFASSEGSRIEQAITRVQPSLTVVAIDRGEFESRTSPVPPMQAGWEYVTGSRLRDDARKYAEDVAEKLRAPSVAPGRKDLILAPSNLWLTIHESVGHPTELDRALGLEANLAGTSFATPDKLGKLRYGTELVTLYADKTTPGGLATCAYDDDGVKTQRWDLVKNGVFVGYQTTRDQAAWIGEKASRGTSYGEDHRSVAFQRMPNVSLAPPRNGDLKLEDMIAATDDGILVTGDGSWSIDHQRYNFQFSGQTFHAIKGGKIAGALRDVAYQSNSVEFWNSCDMIGNKKSWELHGTLHDGKGQPGQSNAVSHGCPPARFRGVNVLNVNTRAKR